MESDRFDALTRSLAAPASRRHAMGALGAGGLLAALRGRSAGAAPTTCSLTMLATTATGKHKDKKYSGTLTLSIGDGGAIDDGRFDLDDGTRLALVGQATGRALTLRVTLADQTILALDGAAELDLVLCRGAASGVFGGPDATDLGTWRTLAGTSTTTGGNGANGAGNGGNGASGNASGSTSGGAATGGAPGAPGGGSTTGAGGGGCASGVVCGGTCCAPLAGFTPDQISCDGNACSCAYSCQAAGCPSGGPTRSFAIGCDARPDALCGEQCNVPADTGCNGMTCPAGQTLDAATCACVAAGGGGCAGSLVSCGDAANPVCADTQSDLSHCGACANDCANIPGCALFGGCGCCHGECLPLITDVNCGTCGNACPANQSCAGGVCECLILPCGGTRCPTPTAQDPCAAVCVDLTGDPANCGACGTACAAGVNCHGGVCGCPNGRADCPGFGCVDLTSDPLNCGACGNFCPTGCSNGACAAINLPGV